jgi:hypothetical protein
MNKQYLIDHGYEIFADDGETSLWQKRWGSGWRIMTLRHLDDKVFSGRSLGWEDSE